MRARLKRRPEPVPVFTYDSSSLRSSAVKLSRYCFAGISPLLVFAPMESVPQFTYPLNPTCQTTTHVAPKRVFSDKAV